MNLDFDATYEIQDASQRYLDIKNIFKKFADSLVSQTSNNTGFVGLTIEPKLNEDHILASIGQIKIRCQLVTYLSIDNRLEGLIVFLREHLVDRDELIKLGSINFNQNGDLDCNLKNSTRVCNLYSQAEFVLMHYFKIALSIDVDKLI